MKSFSTRAVIAVAAAALAIGAGIATAANQFGKPTTIVHVITVKWKEGTTPEQIKAAVDGVEKVAANYPGIKNVWTKTLKVQGQGYSNALVMEFESKAAFDAYTNSPAQKEWYKTYLPIRSESTTHDITN
ncbi:MAG: Dabb family protein [Bryobacteraceae bacterium]